MKNRFATRFLLECGIAVVSGITLVLTLIRRDWIESVFHVDPDQSSGFLEWAIVAALLVATLTFTLLARVERTRFLARVRQRDRTAGTGSRA